MKQRIITFLMLLAAMPFILFGQSYSSLWKKAQEAENKDLPQTQYDIIQKIVKKAEKEKAYGQLLKAELKGAQVMMSISTDSLTPAVELIRQRGEAAKDEALKIVYQTVLWKVCSSNSNIKIEVRKPVLDEHICQILANIKEGAYDPFVISGDDSGYFNDDLLSVVGYELRDFEPMYNYYKKVGNRKAACLTGAEAFKYDYYKLSELISQYQDLQEAGALAIARYHASKRFNSGEMTVGEEVGYLEEAINRWGSWKGMNTLRNSLKSLTSSKMRVDYETRVNLPMRPMKIELSDIRNISSVTMSVYRVKADGDISLNPNYKDDYKKLKPLLSSDPITVMKKFSGRHSYDIFEDSLNLEGLPIGVYMLEFTTSPSTEVERRLYFVTDIYTLSESQPGNKIRYVVVNATTSQPVPGAHLRIRQYKTYKDYITHEYKVSNRGELNYTPDATGRQEVFAYTDDDKACPEMSVANRYRYYGAEKNELRTNIYTDRAIYRPGQTVHAAALLYNVIDGYQHSATEGKSVSFTLRDANWKEVKKLSAKTDGYGMCSVDFTLPSSGLTGRYTIQVNGQSYSFRVEEYKRPTFEVEFPEVKQDYKAGDTLEIRGLARTYSGVPVQGADVEYKVVRRMAFWWWSYWRYYDGGFIGTGHDDTEVFEGEAVTDDDGTFVVRMPLTMPESKSPLFYNFIVTADVTDTGGETHSGTLSVPLGNRKTALSVDLEDQVLIDSKPTMMFHLRNAAGKDIDAEVRYRIDDGDWLKIKTTVKCDLSAIKLKSGKHTLEAVYEDDTITREFVVFSLNDKRPATETDDWFWQSDSRFPNNGKPVTVQVGSSDSDVHIVYSIYSGDNLIETGAIDRTNELLNRKITYKESYGNGVVMSFAWVKNGKCYTHTAEIQRPLPDKKLDLQWATFRDRLTPGQQEDWTLTVKKDGKPVDAILMATMFDKSLDQLQKHYWNFTPYVHLPLPSVQWNYLVRNNVSLFLRLNWDRLAEKDLSPSKFDDSVYPTWYAYHSSLRISGNRMYKTAEVFESRAVGARPMLADAAVNEAADASDEAPVVVGYGIKKEESAESEPQPQEETPQVQVRENLNETAFFYPQLTTDSQGNIALKFTLPESLTTWRFMGLAHTKDMCYGKLESEAIAQKDVMIQPNMPRFIREGDKACITARIFNLTEKAIAGKASLRLIDPETDKVVCNLSQPFSLGEKATGTSVFDLSEKMADISKYSILICQVIASGEGFSDGEQHYLPILPSSERVTVTLPFTQIEPGTKDIDLASLVPADARDTKLTFEYTNNPAWLMIQALPTVGKPIDENAVSQAASYYANSIGKYLIDLQPKAKTAFELWKKESGSETSLMSALEKNQELKDIVLNETPWVLDADRETEQKERLIDFFDENTMNNRLSSALTKLQQLQRSDGSWSWWPDMPGSFYMTVTISEMLVRLNALTGTKPETRQMLDHAFRFMGEEVKDIVKEMKKEKWKSFPSLKTLQWLYLCSLDGRELPSDVKAANNYLMPLLKKDIRNQSIYEKAMTAVILSKSEPKLCEDYVKSLKEYTVYREEMGRYYDTKRAGYSWFDYKIPTQTMAIEAIQRITPEDTQCITEMQRWLLQSKRTQAWDTPINSVNAVYAFLWQQGEQNISPLSLDKENAAIRVDAQSLATPNATAALGYVKTVLPDTKAKQLSVDKSSDGVSWGAVYAQFTQATKNIADQGSGLKVKREIITADGKTELMVGDRIKIRITIIADRDYDFVQVIDRRAACLEPVVQLSGYRNGAYCTPRDYTTNYYFDMFRKGEHVVETEYFIDREGTYETGTCTVGCAYAPEFRATTSSMTFKVNKK
ncbi:MAG: alpha-2-macroglobulin [Prevotella sp.]|nr:alpha-2-macroglobulin [Prevotella sp.]